MYHRRLTHSLPRLFNQRSPHYQNYLAEWKNPAPPLFPMGVSLSLCVSHTHTHTHNPTQAHTVMRSKTTHVYNQGKQVLTHRLVYSTQSLKIRHWSDRLLKITCFFLYTFDVPVGMEPSTVAVLYLTGIHGEIIIHVLRHTPRLPPCMSP